MAIAKGVVESMSCGYMADNKFRVVILLTGDDLSEGYHLKFSWDDLF